MKTRKELKLDYIRTLLKRDYYKVLTIDDVRDYWNDEIRYDYCITWDEWLEIVINDVNAYNASISKTVYEI